MRLMRRIRTDQIRAYPFNPSDPWSITTRMSENPVRVCAVVAEATMGAARAAIKQAASIADLIEVRLDYLRDFDFADLARLRALLEGKPLPAIITSRATSEGGKLQVDDQIRLRL